MKQKKVTFADIAAYTGFSKTTISRYFNNPDSLTLENQEKIAHALDVLGYQENKLAKVLANGKSEFVGIIIPNLYLHYYSEISQSDSPEHHTDMYTYSEQPLLMKAGLSHPSTRYHIFFYCHYTFYSYVPPTLSPATYIINNSYHANKTV